MSTRGNPHEGYSPHFVRCLAGTRTVWSTLINSNGHLRLEDAPPIFFHSQHVELRTTGTLPTEGNFHSSNYRNIDGGIHPRAKAHAPLICS